MIKFLNTSLIAFFALIGCTNSQKDPLKDLNSCKQEFISKILTQPLDESPFQLNYSLKTSLFSESVISIFGEMFVYDHLPHGWIRYEGMTFYKNQGKFIPLTLDDFFSTSPQKEWLRNYCEQYLKTDATIPSYFLGNEPLLSYLEPKAIGTFVLEPTALCIIFQPYTVAGHSNIPVIIKISYDELRNHWNPSNPLTQILPIAQCSSSCYKITDNGK